MFKKILVIGCGLIGSSILRGVIKNKISKKFFVYEKSKKNVQKIRKINNKIIILKKLDNNISDIDLVIISTPMSEYEKIIPHLNKYMSKNCIITDVGSTKQNILKLKNKNLSKSLDWITSHPISGSEVSGPEYGTKNLFVNKWCILVNDKNKIKQNKLLKFWKKLGSNVIIMDSKIHDKIFSITSHLPHLIAYNLIKTAQDFQKTQKKSVIKFSAGGLRDFSRIAASNEIMWRDIFFNNKKNIVNAINLFIKNLNSFKKNIENFDDKTLRKKLTNSKKVRQQILDLKQDVAKPDFGRDQD
tara:strand:+ start:84 stop:983 length:900 start_codon:yes stop_codon:yes gene_type:complete